MFVRKKPNKSGVVSIQIIDKSSGRYRLIKTVGSSADRVTIDSLFIQARQMIPALKGQGVFNFEIANEQILMDMFFNGLDEIQLVGPELVLGKLFDEIGFNKVPEELFRYLVITRLAYPVSKLKTADYLFKYKGVKIDVDKIYRYLDKLSSEQKETIQQISYTHTLGLLNNSMGVVFYDVTTLYFEIEEDDDLRKTGFSKEGKHQHPQIVLGLLVSVNGYPLAYEIFEGNRYEGHTLLPVIEKFKHTYQLDRLVVIADAGLLSNENISELQSRQYEYILGARIKNESLDLKKQILSIQFKNGQSTELVKDENTKIIVSYSQARAKKDAANRKKGLEKLQRSIASGKLTKSNINNRGYNKYLKLEGELKISIDKARYLADAKWDGLKGYITNTKLSKDEIIDNYKQLWKIEKAFRISKTDLRIRPIYHRLKHRIEAHICIAFCAYKIYKELERQLEEKQTGLSAEKAIDIAKTIYRITITRPFSKTKESRLHLPKEEQQNLLKWFSI